MLNRILFFTVSLAPIAVLLYLAFAGTTGVLPQESEELAECEQLLSSPRFDDLLTRHEGKDFRELSSMNSGRALVGLECSVDLLTAFFEDAGWELTEYVKQTHAWVDRKYVRVPENVRGSVAYFCLKRPTLFGMFDFRCRALASVRFQGSRVSSISTGVNK
jgi:hypothetical protein